MDFRTTYIAKRSDILSLKQDTGILMLGSCFTDNIGTELEADGFKVSHNPMGPLYNPASILFALNRISVCRGFDAGDISFDERDGGSYHCLAFASRYQDKDWEKLLEKVNTDFNNLATDFANSKVVIITLGTSMIYKKLSDGQVAGNCHKFPASFFSRELLSADKVYACLNAISRITAETGKTLIYTVSPIRHLADGMAVNSVSKARLIDGVNRVALLRPENVIYFPAFEIMNDDLRDYRFYSPDMTHPSQVAVEYIYSLFKDTFFAPETIEKARMARKEYKASLHRPIIN